MSMQSHDRSDAERPMPELDVLLSRAVAGERDALREVRERGRGDPSILDDLAMMQADELRLARAAGVLEERARRIGLPRPQRPLTRWTAGLGWAVAAVLLLALLGQLVAPGDPRASLRAPGAAISTQGAALGGAFATSDEAFDAYLAKAREEGVVIGDVAPPVLVGSREVADGGGFEVLVVRTVYERRRAPELYRRALIGEAGRPGAIVIRPKTEAVQ